MTTTNTHGGYRPGSGAPKQAPPNAKRHTLLLTDTEYAQIKEYLKQLRNKN